MIIGIIPARYDSSRFPGKPLVDLKGKSMIQRVYEQCSKSNSLDKVVVATDDQRIFKEVNSFGGEVKMTSKTHESGTDRCHEVLKYYPDASIIINIQGDEPLIDPKEIDKLVTVFCNEKADIATLIKESSKEDIQNSNLVKVVTTSTGKALYFSRSPIPFERNENKHQKFFQHIGIYGYRKEALEKVSSLSVSPLELTEGLEQLRWLENNINIFTERSDFQSLAIDTPEDVEKVLQRLL